MDSSLGNSVLLLRPLAVVLGRLGVDGDAFLAGVGVGPTTPPDTYIPTPRVDRALEEVAAERRDPTFSLTMAREALVRPLGLFSHLVWLSGTLRDALTQAARFYSLVTQRATLTLEEGPEIATFTQRMKPGVTRGNILTEFAFASFFLRARAATSGRFWANEMRFSHRAAEASAYEAFFEAPVTFGAPVDELVFDAPLLELPLCTADPFTAAAIERQATQIRTHAEPDPLVERLRTAVQAELPSSRPSLTTVARRLGVGARSLRRQLEEQKLSLRAIVASARHERAVHLLAEGASIKEVAFELGFSEPSAFSRAYKRWTGRPPGAR